MLKGEIVDFDYRLRHGIVAVSGDTGNRVWLLAIHLPRTIRGRLSTQSLKGTRINFTLEIIEGSLCAVNVTADVTEPRVEKPIPPEGSWTAAMVVNLAPHHEPRPVVCVDIRSHIGYAFVPRLPRRKITREVWREAAGRAGVKWMEGIGCRTITLYATMVVNGELVFVKSQALVCPWGVIRNQTDWVKVGNYKEVPMAVIPPAVRGLLIHIKTLRPAAQPRSSAQARAQFLLALARLDKVGRVVYTNEDMIRNVTFPSAPKADDLDSALAQANQSATASA